MPPIMGAVTVLPAMKAQLRRVSRYFLRCSWIEGLALLYASLFLIVLVAAYRGQLPLEQLSRIPYYDKLGHVLLYAIATYLGHQVCYRWRLFGGLRLPAFPILFGIATVAEELTQGLAPSRTLDPIDLICSVGGIFLGYGLAAASGRSK